MRVVPFVAALFLFSSQSSPQQSATVVQRDPQAVALLQGSLKTMGGAVPADSAATGSITIVAGSQTSTGTVRILSRGTDQSSEQITLPQSTNTLTYSRGLASETLDATAKSLSLERTA